MLEQHKELTVEKLPKILFQTYINRLINKKVMVEQYGFTRKGTGSGNTWMQKEREE